MSRCTHEELADIGTFQNPQRWKCMECGEEFDERPGSEDEPDPDDEGSQVDILADIRDILADMRLALIKIAGIE